MPNSANNSEIAAIDIRSIKTKPVTRVPATEPMMLPRYTWLTRTPAPRSTAMLKWQIIGKRPPSIVACANTISNIG